MSVCDEEAIDIVYGDMLRQDFDIFDPLNYSAVAIMPCELFSISKRNFANFVRERAHVTFKANLVTLHPDWVLRRCFIHNQGWAAFKRGFVDFKLSEVKTLNGGANKYHYGHQNFIIGSNRSMSTMRAARPEYQDFKVQVDLSVLRANEHYGLSAEKSSRNQRGAVEVNTTDRFVKQRAVVLESVRVPGAKGLL